MRRLSSAWLFWKGGSRYLDLLLAASCLVVLIQGLGAVERLDRPRYKDLHRDAATAQNMLDGHFLADQFYRGEFAWYPPLVPSLVAAFSWSTDLPVLLLYTRLGAYLNLLIPISFYIMLVFLFDRWTAAAGIVGFLFVVGSNLPDWVSARYSPDLLSGIFAQTLFYLTLLLYSRVLQAQQGGSLGMRRWGHWAVGVLLGLTFLTDVAPALILGVMILAASIQMIMASPHPRRVIIGAVQIVTAALLVSAPFLYTILWHYHLKILNPFPSNYVYDILTIQSIVPFISQYLSPTGIMEILGFAYLLRSVHGFKRTLLISWVGVSGAYIAYDWLRQFLSLEGLAVPSIEPSFHFLFYLKAFEAVCFGCGLILLSRLIVGLAERVLSSLKPRLSIDTLRRSAFQKTVLGVTMLTILLSSAPFSETRKWISAPDPHLFLQVFKRPIVPAEFTWIRTHTRDTDVFLASDDVGIYTVAPAGRKVVAVNVFFSNPYVDHSVRSRDRDLMFDDLLSGGKQGQFRRLATEYHVEYVIDQGDECQILEQQMSLHLAFTGDTMCILRVLD